MKKVIFVTYVTGKDWLDSCGIPLENSSKYFHPDIDFKIFTLEELKNYNSDISIGNAKALIGKILIKEYELVAIFDADTIITGRLDDLLVDDYDIAGVRNASDHGSVHMETNLDLFQVSGVCNKQQYMNAGLVASYKKDFFEDWDNLKHIKRFDLDQGTLNMAAYSGKYRLKILDPIESNSYYGVSNSWGDKTAWDSWKDMRLIDNKLLLKNKQGKQKEVKILHKAGSGREAAPGDKFSYDLFSVEVFSFLKKITK